MAGLFNDKQLQEKRALLSDIFALKTGLSILEEMRDEELKLQTKIDKEPDRITIINREVQFSENKVHFSEPSEFRCKKQVKTKDLFPRPIKYIKDHNYTPILDFFLFSLVTYLIILIGLGVSSIWYRSEIGHYLKDVIFNTTSNALIFGAYLPIIAIGVMVVGLILWAIGAYTWDLITYPKHKKWQIQRNKELEWDFKEKSEQEDKTYQNNLAQYKKLLNEQEKIKKDVPIKIQEYQNRKNAIHKLGENVFQVLINTYSPYIALSDWENINYIIYLIASNRCDSIKEALLYIDNEDRFEELIESIDNAAAEIRGCISNSMRAIGNDIQTSVRRLSDEINDYNHSLNEQNDIYEEQNRILSDISDQAGIQNRILETIKD